MTLRIVLFLFSFAMMTSAHSAALLDAANDLVGTYNWEYYIENPETGYNGWFLGGDASSWSFTENADNTLSATATFYADGKNLFLQDTFQYRYLYDSESDVTIWGFFPTDGQAHKPLQEALFPAPGAPLVISSYTINLELWSSCLAYCDNPYPDAPQLPLPGALWLFCSAIFAVAFKKLLTH